jgi:hypothetical protein
MSEPRVNGSGLRLWIPWSLLLGAAAGLIIMYADVRALKDEIKTKAPREVVTAQYEALLQRLDRIERKLDERRP